MKTAIGYLRVSTVDQAESGFGIESQKAELHGYCKAHRIRLGAVHIEIASAKGGDTLAHRPKLQAAIAEAKDKRCALLIPRLDRLSRDVGELARVVVDSGVNIISVVEGRMDTLKLVPHAHRVEAETRMLSERTKAGIARAKALGIRLGNRTNLDVAQKRGAQSNAAKARGRHLAIEPVLHELGLTIRTPQGLADALNARGILSASGKPWTASNVRRVLKEIGKMKHSTATSQETETQHISDDLTMEQRIARDPDWGSW